MADKNEDAILVRNLQADYDNLTRKIPEASSELSGLYKDIEKAKSDLKAIEAQKLQSTSEASVALANVETEKRTLEQNTKEHQTKVIEADTELKTTLLKVKESLKDLSRVNEMVLAANEELDALKQLLVKSDEAQFNLLSLQSDIVALKKEIELLTLARDEMNAELSTSSTEWESKLKAARDELAVLVHMASEKTKEAEQAQYRVKTYTDELYTHMNNYQIVKSRLELVWQKTFPELEIPL